MLFRRICRYLPFLLVFLLGLGAGIVIAPRAKAALSDPLSPGTSAPVAPVYAPPSAADALAGRAPLRVLVLSKQRMLAWKADAAVRVLDAKGTVLYTAKPGEVVGIVRDAADGSCQLRQNGKNFCPAPGTLRLECLAAVSVWTPTPDTWQTFGATLAITPTADGNFSVARELLLEDYLRNVLPGEMPSTFAAQALRAQAVAARTYTLIELGRHAVDGADLCGTEHCQMCLADAKRTPEADRAVAETRGLVLYAGDKLTEPYYSSCCGGATDDAGVLWGAEFTKPYLAGVADLPAKSMPRELTVGSLLAATDAYCKGAPSSHWTRTFTADQLNALVGRNLPLVTNDPTAQIHAVANIAVEERAPNGRVGTLRVEGDGASILVYGDQTRWLFGNGAPGPEGLWSALFDLKIARADNGAIAAVTITGAGHGHGIGMCQWGADGRARAGQTFREILKAYYPGTRLSDEK